MLLPGLDSNQDYPVPKTGVLPLDHQGLIPPVFRFDIENMAICVLNKSSLVHDNDFQQMCVAVAAQAWYHAAPAWKKRPVLVKAVAHEALVHANDWPIVISDTPDQADALGWHSEENGRPFGNVFAQPVFQSNGDACRKPLSVASVLSHEVLETLFDPGVQLWADSGDGLWAYEVCDPVEGDSYEITVQGQTTMVSNFVFPSFFDSQATGKVDWMGTAPGPFQVAKQGYCEVWKATGQPTEVYGEHYDPTLSKVYG